MKVLWSPWRIQYILSDKGGECVFCRIPRKGEKEAAETDRDNLVLYRSRYSYVIMNRFPYTGGHLMVVPYLHTSSFEGLSDAVLSDMMRITRLSVQVLTECMRPEGFNTGINIGQAAGAGIEEHLHVHIVPRWVGDSSFIAMLDEVRVIPEHIMQTYDKLHPVFNRNA